MDGGWCSGSRCRCPIRAKFKAVGAALIHIPERVLASEFMVPNPRVVYTAHGEAGSLAVEVAVGMLHTEQARVGAINDSTNGTCSGN
jgi:hypothetical protein